MQCSKCQKEFKSKYALAGHTGYCQKPISKNRFGHSPWNKNRFLNLQTRQKISASLKGREGHKHTPQSIEKLRKNAGGRREGAGRGKKQWYFSPIAGKVFLHSSYEVRYAQFLDSQKCNWQRNWKQFSYFFDGKDRKYTHDFYLLDENEYVEVKGFETEKDRAKWKQFPEKLKIIREKDLPPISPLSDKQLKG